MEHIELILFTILIIAFKFVYKFGKNILENLGIIECEQSGNPFRHDSRLPLKPFVIHQQSRDTLLRQAFSVDKIPANLDAIVIGSGIGGLSAAAILSKAGKKVLVLEQHDQAGGCCHSFVENGYEFNMGIHYVGEMDYKSITRTYIDQISDGQIQWGELDEEYDVVVFKTENDEAKEYFITGDTEKQKKYLKAEFPDEVVAIDKYYESVDEVLKTIDPLMCVKFLPIWLLKLMESIGIIGLFFKFCYWNNRTVKEFTNELTSNQTLRDIFSYSWAVYGIVPSQAGFPIQALLTSHYAKGAFFPVGGASQIPFSIIPVIERGGGKVLVQAEVLQILVGEKGHAVGVKVKHEEKEHEIFAPIIISGAGILNTEKFLPRQNGSLSHLRSIVTPKDTIGLLTALVGLNVSSSELNIKIKSNYYVVLKNDLDKNALNFLHMSREECVHAKIPELYISFCSSKDLLWEKRYPGKTTMTVFIPTNYTWFEEWENKPVHRRGDDYEAFKNALGSNAINIVTDLFPIIKDHIDYVHFRSPISFNNSLRRTRGSIGGTDHNQARFNIMNVAMLRPTTNIPGLYLTGQDIIHFGFLGAAMGGLLCAQQVLERPLFFDLQKLHEKLNKI